MDSRVESKILYEFKVINYKLMVFNIDLLGQRSSPEQQLR